MGRESPPCKQNLCGDVTFRAQSQFLTDFRVWLEMGEASVVTQGDSSVWQGPEVPYRKQ